MKKILFFVNVDWFFVSHRLNLAEAALVEGYEVHICCQFTKNKSFLLSRGFFVHEVNLKRGQRVVPSLIWGAAVFVKLMFLIRPNVLHTITAMPNIIGGTVSWFFKSTKVFIAISGFGKSLENNGFLARIRSSVVKLVYKIVFANRNVTVIVQNPSDRETVLKISQSLAERIELILGSGVDLFEYFPSGRRGKCINVLFAGRLLQSKGILEFLELAHTIRTLKKNDSVCFFVAGMFDKANPECISHDVISVSHKNKEIVYLGNLPNLSEQFRKTDIFIYPSVYGEGIPRVLCEAAASGVPVITTDHPGCAHSIIHGKTGLLVSRFNPTGLEDALCELMHDRDKLCTMGKNARLFAMQHFDIEKITRKHIKLYTT